MAKLKVADLAKLRKAQQAARQAQPAKAGNVELIVGTGTCGIAAGANETIAVLRAELQKAGLTNVTIRQTGCMGLCHSEPTVEVLMRGMPPVVYGRVDEDTARQIVHQHIGRGLLVNDHIYDKPMADFLPA